MQESSRWTAYLGALLSVLVLLVVNKVGAVVVRVHQLALFDQGDDVVFELLAIVTLGRCHGEPGADFDFQRLR